jgi:uncharacterized protein YjbI with pentapeptide repeats
MCYAMLRYAMLCNAMLRGKGHGALDSVTNDGETPMHGALCYATLCYAMLCYAMCHATLRYATLCYATLCYATLRYAMLRYAMLRYATLRYAMLCYAPISIGAPLGVGMHGLPPRARIAHERRLA